LAVVAAQKRLDAVVAAQRLVVEHALRSAVGDDGSVVHENDACGEPGGERQVVHDGDHERVVCVVGERTHDLELMVRVELGDGLIDEQDRCAHRKRARELHARVLAAGKLVDGAVGERFDFRLAHGPLDRIAVHGARTRAERAVGQAAERHEIPDFHRPVREWGLRQVGHRACAPTRIAGVETGGCPHTAIREDASVNLEAVHHLLGSLPGLEILFVESGGDNLAATFSPELVDATIYVIDVAEGDKIPRKGGPGITRSDLLVINKIDLAPYVGADLSVMERDSKRMRGDRPFVFTNLRDGTGADRVVDWIRRELLFES